MMGQQGQGPMMTSQGQVIASIGMGGGGTVTMAPNARMQGSMGTMMAGGMQQRMAVGGNPGMQQRMQMQQQNMVINPSGMPQRMMRANVSVQGGLRQMFQQQVMSGGTMMSNLQSNPQQQQQQQQQMGQQQGVQDPLRNMLGQ